MNILVIITPYSPAQDPNTIRWSNLINELKDKGHSIHILTTKHSSVANEYEESNIRIYRTGSHTLLDAVYNAFGIQKRRHEPGYVPGKNSIIGSIIQGLIDRSWRKLYWPDGQMLFLKPGIALGKKIITKHKIDQIISVGAPFTSHWIACKLKSIFPNISWHMDIQDPFSYASESRINNEKRYKKKNQEAESLCFEKANSISVPYEKSAQRYSAIFPNYSEKINVIPPLYSSPNNMVQLIGLDSNKIHLAYFGSFYEDIRSPQALLRILEYTKENHPKFYSKLQFHFIGQQNNYSLAVFDRSPHILKDLIFHGFKKRDEAMSLLGQMDYLINFGNTTDYHLPSRVVEYLYFNKPTINFCAIRQDSFATFIGDSLPIINLYPSQEVDKQYASIQNFIEDNRGDCQPNLEAVLAFMPDKLADTYLNVMQAR